MFGDRGRNRIEADSIITPSLLDRLVVQDPENPADPPPPRGRTSYRNFEAGVARDLEWLLNSRRNPDPLLEGFPDILNSVYGYGLPDISSLTLSSPADRTRLLRMLETTIAKFEPRLKDIKVSLDHQPGYVRVLKFRIEAMLDVDPAPEMVSFDTELQVGSGEIEVK